MTHQPLLWCKCRFEANGIRREKDIRYIFCWGTGGVYITDIDYTETIERVLTAGKSTMKILKDFDPLSPSIIKRPPQDGVKPRTPVEMYARRAAFATPKSRSLLVATKYQEALKEEEFEIFKKELDMLVEQRNKKNILDKNKDKSKRLINTNKMEVDPIGRTNIV